MRAGLYGIGFIEKPVSAYGRNGNHQRYISFWRHMFHRCYSQKVHADRPTYQGCSVHQRFHKFEDFLIWAEEQVGNDQQGWELDKDLIVKGNTVYGPETCVFLPPRINKLFMASEASRGDLPIGVIRRKGSQRFTARCHTGNGRKQIGSFASPAEAFAAYKVFKEEVVKSVAEKYRGLIDDRAYLALMSYTVEITD